MSGSTNYSLINVSMESTQDHNVSITTTFIDTFLDISYGFDSNVEANSEKRNWKC